MTQLDLLAGRVSPLPPARSILEHEVWPKLVRYAHSEPTCGGWRIELHALPVELAHEALAATVRCAAPECQNLISPIRSRKAPGNKRHDKIGHGLYIAVSCPLKVCAGCSKGKAPAAEILRIRDAIWAAVAS